METKYYLYESKYNDYSEFWITTRMYDGKKLKPVAQAGTIPELETVANATNNFAACITSLVCSTATAHARLSRN